MARKAKSVSVYERIEKVQSEIALTEQHLVELKAELEELFAEKDDLEMRETWAAIKNKGLTMDDLQKILENTSSNK